MRPPHSLVSNLNLDFLAFSAPKFPIFPPSNLNFPHLPPFSPIFPTLAHFPDSVPLNVPKLGTSEPCIIHAMYGSLGTSLPASLRTIVVLLSGPQRNDR